MSGTIDAIDANPSLEPVSRTSLKVQRIKIGGSYPQSGTEHTRSGVVRRRSGCYNLHRRLKPTVLNRTSGMDHFFRILG